MFSKNNMYKRLFITLIFVWFLLFTIVPFTLLLLNSFNNDGTFALNTYYNFFDYSYLKITFETFIYAIIITLVCVFFALNLAFYISKFKNRNLIISLILVPTYLNLLLKIYAFISILGTEGLINQLLAIINVNIQFLFTIKGFLIVTTYVFLPICLAPIYYSIVKINQNTLNAAYDLGAKDYEVLYKIIIPQIKGTIYNSVQLVFIPSLSLFMITRIIGGNKIITLGTLIEQHFLVTNDWQMGATLSIILIILATISMLVLKKIMRVEK